MQEAAHKYSKYRPKDVQGTSMRIPLQRHPPYRQKRLLRWFVSRTGEQHQRTEGSAESRPSERNQNENNAVFIQCDNNTQSGNDK